MVQEILLIEVAARLKIAEGGWLAFRYVKTFHRARLALFKANFVDVPTRLSTLEGRALFCHSTVPSHFSAQLSQLFACGTPLNVNLAASRRSVVPLTCLALLTMLTPLHNKAIPLYISRHSTPAGET